MEKHCHPVQRRGADNEEVPVLELVRCVVPGVEQKPYGIHEASEEEAPPALRRQARSHQDEGDGAAPALQRVEQQAQGQAQAAHVAGVARWSRGYPRLSAGCHGRVLSRVCAHAAADAASAGRHDDSGRSSDPDPQQQARAQWGVRQVYEQERRVGPCDQHKDSAVIDEAEDLARVLKKA